MFNTTYDKKIFKCSHLFLQFFKKEMHVLWKLCTHETEIHSARLLYKQVSEMHSVKTEILSLWPLYEQIINSP